ncbi:uncharacterized protein BDR25DRAFT_299618 [Lindgomyces ingoldianus]|uniref:Uncharacterized protein n=1 Tax=Lindgomyces ingoldianus TaxID=673940 RepID=A0ACB6RGF9_9PLEO|nr:uncharacterized protein BDR25DRAFT_299618 [Lindgomyces ingoldianus]KAF2477848.1 hypothetical protein BDR25DRAFT_299618 [Lindgomyces ingoldianus]
MASEHRKIDLQSPADLTHIESQIRHAATQKLNLHLPHVSGHEEDELRQKTEALVNAFVAQVLAGLRKNVAINGMEVEGEVGGESEDVVLKEEFEPFDEGLRARLARLHDRRDRLVGDISKHRRQTPMVAAKRFEERFLREREGDQKAWEERMRSVGEEVGPDSVLNVEGLKRAEEVQRLWERGLEGLAALKGGLPETRARLERCGEVVVELF